MHSQDPSSERDALAEVLRVRDVELATAREGLESARRALMLKQAEVETLTHKMEMMQSENDKLTSHVKILLAGGKLPVSPVTGKVYT